MEIGSINGIQNITGIFNENNLKVSENSKGSSIPFQSLLTDAIDDVKTTGDTLTEEAYKLSTGETDDLHEVTIASTKYSLAVDLFVQIRNKTLDAYNQLMNMNV